MKRKAKFALITAGAIVGVWLGLRWMAEPESNYVPPSGVRKKNPGANNVQRTVYEPRHFADGEVSQYSIRIERGFLKSPVGDCTFTAHRLDADGSARWRFTLKGGALLGLVHYDATSIVNAAFTHTREYHTVQKDLASRRVDLVFDEKNRVCRRSLNGEPAGEVPTEAYTLDPLSIIFKFREMDLGQSGEFSSAVSDGKATFAVKAKVIGREQIKIGGKTYQAILVEPDLGELRGIFRKEEGAKLQIWFSADRHQVALRIKTKIKHGTFIADLENYQRPASPSTVATTPRLITLIIRLGFITFIAGFFLKGISNRPEVETKNFQ